jgi:hypothetical protein
LWLQLQNPQERLQAALLPCSSAQNNCLQESVPQPSSETAGTAAETRHTQQKSIYDGKLERFLSQLTPKTS